VNVLAHLDAFSLKKTACSIISTALKANSLKHQKVNKIRDDRIQGEVTGVTGHPCVREKNLYYKECHIFSYTAS